MFATTYVGEIKIIINSLQSSDTGKVRRSRIALAMRHKLHGISTYELNGLKKENLSNDTL